MGTDRSIEFEGPCPCGQGTIRIDDCEVDHSWPTATPQWYESHLNCESCADRFSLERRGAKFVLVERSALREREQRMTVAREKSREILGDFEVKAAVSSFVDLLNTQKSVAAIFRLLKAAKLEYCSEATFRKHWREADAWVRSNVRPSALLEIYGVLELNIDRLTGLLEELKALELHAAEKPEAYGEPVYVLE